MKKQILLQMCLLPALLGGCVSMASVADRMAANPASFQGLRIAKGTDLGGLKPWKGVWLSAPVEVVVPKAEAKRKAS